MNQKSPILSISCVLVALALAAPAAVAQPNSCDLQGTWVGAIDGGGGFLSSYEGRTRLSGTLDLEWIEIPATIPGVFDDAVAFTQSKGVWRRSGPRSFVYTIFNYALDSDGNVVYALKTSGTKEISEDCKVAEITACLEYFDAVGEPLFCGGCGTATASRLEIGAACSP